MLLYVHNAQAGSHCLLLWGLSAYHSLGRQRPSTASLDTYLVQESQLPEWDAQGQQVNVGRYAKYAFPESVHKDSTRKACQTKGAELDILQQRSFQAVT